MKVFEFENLLSHFDKNMDMYVHEGNKLKPIDTVDWAIDMNTNKPSLIIHVNKVKR